MDGFTFVVTKSFSLATPDCLIAVPSSVSVLYTSAPS